MTQEQINEMKMDALNSNIKLGKIQESISEVRELLPVVKDKAISSGIGKTMAWLMDRGHTKVALEIGNNIKQIAAFDIDAYYESATR